jgi:hypothetical protein
VAIQVGCVIDAEPVGEELEGEPRGSIKGGNWSIDWCRAQRGNDWWHARCVRRLPDRQAGAAALSNAVFLAQRDRGPTIIGTKTYGKLRQRQMTDENDSDEILTQVSEL